MRLESLKYYFAHPLMIYYQAKYKLYLYRNPGVPWITPAAVNFCRSTLTTSMKLLEYGSGLSTLWFADRVKSVTSLEHNTEWFSRITGEIKSRGTHNIDYRLYEGTEDSVSNPNETPYVTAAREFENESFDFIVVDGVFRTYCVQEAIPKLCLGGYLLIDNSNYLPLSKWGVPPSWEQVHHSGNGVQTTTVWRKS